MWFLASHVTFEFQSLSSVRCDCSPAVMPKGLHRSKKKKHKTKQTSRGLPHRLLSGFITFSNLTSSECIQFCKMENIRSEVSWDVLFLGGIWSKPTCFKFKLSHQVFELSGLLVFHNCGNTGEDEPGVITCTSASRSVHRVWMCVACDKERTVCVCAVDPALRHSFSAFSMFQMFCFLCSLPIRGASIQDTRKKGIKKLISQGSDTCSGPWETDSYFS